VLDKIKVKYIIKTIVNMKTLGLILIMATICNMGCYAQSERRVTDESFQRLLDRFETVASPLNYKKITNPAPSMTREEAIRFLHRTDAEMELLRQMQDMTVLFK